MSVSECEPLLGGSDAVDSQLNDGERDAEALEKRASRRTNRAIDIHLLPLLVLLYLFNGLDRGNIGNAQTQGFTNDIGCSPDDLNTATSLFFAFFVLFQPFSAAVGAWLGPKRWIPIIMFLWGVMTVAQTFIWGRGSLLATRLLIGLFEAGFYPTALAYLATFYRPFDLGKRIALFYGQYAIANAFSGAMAYGIFQIQHPVLKPWQLLFLIQGGLTCLLAAVAWVWLPAGPDTAWFLTEEERAWVVKRVRPEKPGITKRDFVETIRDWKLWYVLVCNICASVPSTAFSVFLPLVVQGMGYTALEANLMSVPPAVCGAAGLYLFAWSSDHRRERGYHIVAAITLSLVGLTGVVTAWSDRAKYAALCVFLSGSYVSAPLTAAWLSGNTAASKRGLVLGINGFGNVAGVIGSLLFRAEYAPAYRTPLYRTLGFVVAAMVGYMSYRFALQAVNRHRALIRGAKSDEEIDTETRDAARLGVPRTADRGDYGL
ncbi:major facilitator superfamily transporter [Lasiosphaeris hirsuta]|uniref:Major facilitator superfamily transporter n=1 Tax=Lasiosphaeris hirsuta TaxID=260670 RepID=A0AA40A253_9PEZI|nr:major facilitator superfamily transporter [Lasiosphaeris hirsuta]